MQTLELKSQIPSFARDLRVNLGNVLQSEHLTEQQLWGTALAVAVSVRNPVLLDAVRADAREKLDADAYEDALTAASLMAMNNIYYRFVHLVPEASYGKMPARLRMQGMTQTRVPKADFELWSLAVSAIHGCGMCLGAHERTLVAEGISREAVQDAVRLASVLHAAAVTLEMGAGAQVPTA
jgi:lipoyl-dependent peroxiredoxin subunit D